MDAIKRKAEKIVGNNEIAFGTMCKAYSELYNEKLSDIAKNQGYKTPCKMILGGMSSTFERVPNENGPITIRLRRTSGEVYDVANTPTDVFLVLSGNVITSVSQNCVEVLGYDMGELVGEQFSKITSVLMKDIKSGDSEFIRKDSTIVTLSVSVRTNKEILEMYVTISELQEVRIRILRGQTRRLSKMLEASAYGTGILEITHKTSNIEDMQVTNAKHMEKVLGWTPGDLMGSNLDIIQPQGVCMADYQSSHDIHMNHDNSLVMVVPNVDNCGSHRVCKWTNLPADDSGVAYSAVEDITDKLRIIQGIERLHGMDLGAAGNAEIRKIKDIVTSDTCIKGVDNLLELVVD